MKTIQGIENFPADEASIVTIGTFDGVHLGHQQILKQLTDTGRKSKLKSVLLTFFPHPRMVLQPDIPMRLIQTIQERKNTLENMVILVESTPCILNRVLLSSFGVRRDVLEEYWRILSPGQSAFSRAG